MDSKTLGVSPTRYYQPEPRFGFTPYAELWNGRLAMVGFVIALMFELLSAHAFN
ncbi:MAG: chlorophyll a/b-binding protein [Cyanobacteria bacterium P01_D01_bin.36]